jgi:hypothetical protein
VDLDPVAVVEAMVDLGISVEMVRAASSALLQCTSLTTPIVVAVLRGAGVPAVDAIKIRQHLIKVRPLVLVVVVGIVRQGLKPHILAMNGCGCAVVCMLFVLCCACLPGWDHAQPMRLIARGFLCCVVLYRVDEARSIWVVGRGAGYCYCNPRS